MRGTRPDMTVERKLTGYRVSEALELGGGRIRDAGPGRRTARGAISVALESRGRCSPFSPRVFMSPVDRLAFSFMAPACDGAKPVSVPPAAFLSHGSCAKATTRGCDSVFVRIRPSRAATHLRT